MTLDHFEQTGSMPIQDQLKERDIVKEKESANRAAADQAIEEDALRAETATHERLAQSTETDPSRAPPNRDTAFGQAVWLMMNTPGFKHTFLADLEWMILPAILLDQYRVFYAEGRAVGFAAWAYVSDEIKQRLEGENPRLKPADWKSGENLVLTELFSPFGGQATMLEELEKIALHGEEIAYRKTK